MYGKFILFIFCMYKNASNNENAKKELRVILNSFELRGMGL